jgi:hypothetical protein
MKKNCMKNVTEAVLYHAFRFFYIASDLQFNLNSLMKSRSPSGERSIAEKTDMTEV